MQRLITFGCSYAYGTGLEDCKNWFFNQFHHLKPSKLGWAQTLANKLFSSQANTRFNQRKDALDLVVYSLS